MKAVRNFAIPLSAVAALFPAVVYATNGMNLEGYGPIATGMGGASMAYDNGSAAMMNNPATIGLMPEGHRFDFALGFLGPDVTATAGTMNAKSSGNAYYMPALGWVTKQGGFGYGVGLFAQGGMGTDYKADSFMAAGSNEKVRSEVSVGRLLFPITFDVSPALHIGGSIDYVWAGMDLKMAMPGSQFLDMLPSAFNPAATNSGGTASGGLVTGLAGYMGSGAITGLNWARFDFSDSNKFTGEAKGTGFGGKIGAVFTPNDMITIGVTYHTKTALKDLKTSNATLSMNVAGPVCAGMSAPNPCTIPLTGTIKVQDFEWPAVFGAGVAVKATENLMIAADVKRIGWSEVMKNFKMHFVADTTAGNGAFSGADLDAKLFQNWDDQTVIALGGSYKVDPAWIVRAGYNHASNPIPDSYLNALFPAIQETHVTAGVGYEISKASNIDFSLTKGLETNATNPGSPVAGDEVKTTMSQLNWQFMYSYRY